MQFIKETECNYGHTIARNMANDLTRLAVIAQTNDYLSELDSPRFIIRCIPFKGYTYFVIMMLSETDLKLN